MAAVVRWALHTGHGRRGHGGSGHGEFGDLRAHSGSSKLPCVQMLYGGPVRLYEFSMLRSFRIRAGLSQQELADAVGASRTTVWSLEHGRALPSVTLALALAHALGATVEELFAPDLC